MRWIAPPERETATDTGEKRVWDAAKLAVQHPIPAEELVWKMVGMGYQAHESRWLRQTELAKVLRVRLSLRRSKSKTTHHEIRTQNPSFEETGGRLSES